MQTIDINQSLFSIVAALSVFVGGTAAIALLYAGFLFLFAAENPQREARAWGIIGYAIFGVVVALGAVTLAHLLTTHIVNAPGAAPAAKH